MRILPIIIGLMVFLVIGFFVLIVYIAATDDRPVCERSENHWKCLKFRCEEIGGLYMPGNFGASDCIFPPAK